MVADSTILPDQAGAICSAYRSGSTQAEIARALRVSKREVNAIIRDHISADERHEIGAAHRQRGSERRVAGIQRRKVDSGKFSFHRVGGDLWASFAGSTFRFDADVAALLLRYPWRLSTDGRRLLRQEGTSGAIRNIYIYHDILGVVPSRQLVVDHINRDPTDNRRSNLRLCSPSENALNTDRRAREVAHV